MISPPNATAKPAIALPGLAWLFLRMGALGFGGGMAVVAVMEHELIKKRHLLDHDEFLHGIALGQILGSFATNAALFIGHRLFGFLGGWLCAAAFMAPSVAMVILLSWLYFTFHTIPALKPILLGLGPVVIALILSAAWSMGRKAIQTWPAAMIGALALAGALLKLNSLAILLAAGALGLWLGKARLVHEAVAPSAPMPKNSAWWAAPWPLATASAAAATPSLWFMAWTFLKVGLVFFGGGFVLIPVLHQKLVVALGWLRPQEFLDGVAISNLTPGPIAVLATFVGYRLHGTLGALVATLALFLPALALMSLLAHFYHRFKSLQRAQDLLAGLTPAMVGLILGAAALLAPTALHGLPGVVLGLLVLVLLQRLRWHPALALALGAATGGLGLIR